MQKVQTRTNVFSHWDHLCTGSDVAVTTISVFPHCAMQLSSHFISHSSSANKWPLAGALTASVPRTSSPQTFQLGGPMEAAAGWGERGWFHTCGTTFTNAASGTCPTLPRPGFKLAAAQHRATDWGLGTPATEDEVAESMGILQHREMSAGEYLIIGILKHLHGDIIPKTM